MNSPGEHWEDTPRDESWIPFSVLVAGVQRRYRRLMFVADTGHFGVGRAAWAREIAAQVMLTKKSGVPLEEICFYPVIHRTDWEGSPITGTNCGLWDLRRNF